MTPEDFGLFSALVMQRSGLILTIEKAYLLESRLVPVVRKHNLKSLEDLANSLRNKRDEALMYDITAAMTTNETSFFRDRKTYSFFQKTILPRLIASRSADKKIRIWSAASSSGQEAYSLAMLFAEEGDKLKDWQIEIVGTDFCREMVVRAKSATYTQLEIQRGLPIMYLIRYFQQISGDKWQIKDTIRQVVQFREGNLVTDNGVSGKFDVILCRNVLTCFDDPTKSHIVDSMVKLMPPDGYLLLGEDENLVCVSDQFKSVPGQHGIYILMNAQEDVSSAAVANG